MIPTDELWTAPSLSGFPTYFLRYMPCVVSTSLAGFGRAKLHDGYQPLYGGTGGAHPYIWEGFTGCTLDGEAVNAATVEDHRAFLFARDFDADVSVGVSSSVHQKKGQGLSAIPINGTYLVFSTRGVIARATGGTISNAGTTDVYVSDISCYMLRQVVSGTDVVFQLYRVVAGTATLLAYETFAGWGEDMNLMSLATLTLELETNGSGDVDMRAYFGPISTGLVPAGTPMVSATLQLFVGDVGTVTVTGSGVTATAGTVTDANAAKITADGMVGFLIGRDRLQTAFKVVDLVQQFHAEEIGGGTVYVLDKFSRLVQRIGTTSSSSNFTEYAITDGFGVVGARAEGMFSFGQFANTALSGIAQRLAWDTTNSRAQVTMSAIAEEALDFLSHRPATSALTQHRSCTFTIVDNFTANPTMTGSDRVGILLMTSLASASTMSNVAHVGFVQVTYNGAGAATWTVGIAKRQHLTVNGVPTWVSGNTTSGDADGTCQIIASKTIGTLALGTPFTVDLDIHPNTESPQPQAQLSMVLSIDGVAQVLTAASPAMPNYVVQPTGEVLLLQSPTGYDYTEGFFIESASSLFGAVVRVDTWSQGVLTYGQGKISATTQASITMQGEGTASGDLGTVLTPDFDFEEIYFRRRIESDMESGHTRTSSEDPVNRRSWRITKQSMTLTERDALIAFYDSHYGAEIPFNFTPPDATSPIKVHFIADSLLITQVFVKVFSCDFEIEELIH